MPKVHAVNPIFVIAVKTRRKTFAQIAVGLSYVSQRSSYTSTPNRHPDALAQPMVVWLRRIAFLKQIRHELRRLYPEEDHLRGYSVVSVTIPGDGHVPGS